MKILHVITRLILGGAQQNTVMSCAAQVAAGHEVHLAYGPIEGPEGSMLDAARASGATLHEIPSMVRELAPVKDFRCYRALRTLVQSLKPDVVHSHSSKAGVLARGAAWAEVFNKKQAAVNTQIIHTVHGLAFHDRQSKWTHRLYVRLERWAARRCHHLIAITPEMVDAFAQQGIAPRDKFTVIASGVEVDAFAAHPEARAAVRERHGLPADAYVVGHVGRLDTLKGHADLLDVLPLLRAQGEEHGRDVWLFFVGDGFGRHAVENHANMALGKTVLAGRVDLDQVPDCLAAMDVMTLPSYQEGQSRTLVEAQLAGLPVVAYATGGIPSVCGGGGAGRLVPTGDKDALAQAILSLASNPAAAAQLARAGQTHARLHFGAKRMNDALLMLYAELLGGRHPMRA
ncbi:MAG: glycosyltransferase [Algisphaera sp.]